jgi:UDP-2-acetamido-3-amino-2,3-dideoxy-glucuronate N-acetyltransferase
VTGFKAHPTSQVDSEQVGVGTVIWQNVVVLRGAIVGANCNLNCNTFVEGGARLGDRVTLKCGVYLWDGVTLEDDVFVGPNATFTNDLRPRSQQHRPIVPTLVRKGASIGANASILCGTTVGRHAMVGMGAVVTKDVPAHALVRGVPATVVGWVDESGESLQQMGHDFRSHDGRVFCVGCDGLTLKT